MMNPVLTTAMSLGPMALLVALAYVIGTVAGIYVACTTASAGNLPDWQARSASAHGWQQWQSSSTRIAGPEMPAVRPSQ
jgi:hypothetical protein